MDDKTGDKDYQRKTKEELAEENVGDCLRPR